MINWDVIVFEEIQVLARIAASYNIGINEMLQHLDMLNEEQRAMVQSIAEKHAHRPITSRHDVHT